MGTPTIKFAQKAAVHRVMYSWTGAPGPDDALVKQLQEEALRKEYGINVDLQIETASAADLASLADLRMQTQAVDSVQYTGEQALNKIAMPGLLQDIDAQLKQYGPNLLQQLPAGGFQFFAGANGKYYAIPWLRDTPVDPEFYHIRRDWLDKIGRDVPTTIEELEECLRLFKEKKLGGDVTIPLASEQPGWINEFLFAGPFAPEPEEQFKMLARGENIDRLTGAIIREDRLEVMQRWYKDGLINPEYANWKYDQTIGAITKGMVGCLFGMHTLLNGALQTQVEKADPKQDWVQIFPPPSRKGKPGTGRVNAGGALARGTIFASWSQCPEAMIAAYDWVVKDFKNYILAVYGIEGKHWKWGSGGWIEDLRSPAPNQEYSGMRRVGRTTPIYIQQLKLPAQPGKEPKDTEWLSRIYTNIHTRKQAHVPEKGEYPTITQVDHWCPYLFTKSAKYRADLLSLQSEYLAKIVRGTLPASSGVKEFWTKWRAAGGDEYMKEMSDIFNKWLAQHPEWKDPRASFSPDSWNTTIKYPGRKKT
jgi:ABC-type glycerol-3-phosphate transport system substrate-binding protein